MIENKQEVSKDLEKALQALEQAKQRVANEKKKQNEKKRKAENHHKYIMGGIIVKYFPDCYSYDEDELNRILSVALQTRECQQIISKIKSESKETTPPQGTIPNVENESGERIPLIDKKTGEQKVDQRNRKQWKCQTIESTDWNSRENAKMWRKDLADTINATNEQLGIAVHWEHRSFKEQGIDREPTVHIGAVANALECKGVQTERGNINREIIKRNMILEQAKEMLELAKQEVRNAQYAAYYTQIKNAAVSVKNEVMEMIAKVAERKGRLDLPIVSGKHLRKISDRTALQSAGNAEEFITTRKIDNFESLAKFTADTEQIYRQLEEVHLSKGQKLSRLKELSKMYALYAPVQATYKESQSLKGFAKMKYDKEHKDSLAKYPELRERMQSLLDQGEKITPKQWKAEIQSLQAECDNIGREQSKTATELAYTEVISYNKKNLERELQNENRQHNRQQGRTKRREEEI